MKITKIERIQYEEPVPVYDVINAAPNHNFIIQTPHAKFVSHNCVIFDEVNFGNAGVKDIVKAKKVMKEKYDTLVARVTGTFVRNGEVFGKIYVISSKNSDSDFMEEYIQSQKEAHNEHMYIFDKPQWEVWPRSKYSSDRTFKIALGGRHLRSFVVPDEQSTPEGLQELISMGYKLLDVPEDNKTRFLSDFDVALRDIAGITVQGTMSFITQDVIDRCVGERKNPFYTDVLEIGTKSTFSIEQYFHKEVVDPRLFSMPMFIHLDLSLTTDRSGISGVAVTGRRDVDMDGKKLSVPTFSHVFSIALQAPRGDKVAYLKITQFICWLRNNAKFNIFGVSRDQFQSEYLAQLLDAQGFATDKLSLDRSSAGYDTLRSVLLEERIDLLHVPLLEDELIHLQRDPNTGVCDHPAGGCFTGDTKVRLVDGRSVSMADLVLEQQYKQNWVYTINEATGKIEPKPIQAAFQSKITSDIVKVTLDNGQVITCTPEHRFMLRDGTYSEAQNLREGQSLMPLYTKLSHEGLEGYRLYYDPVPGNWHYEHRQFCTEALLVKGMCIHHQNYNKLDNRPTNLLCMTSSEHASLHNNRTTNYAKISKAVKNWHSRNKGSEVYKERSNKISRKVRQHFLSDENYQKKLKDKKERIQKIEKYYNVIWSDLSASERARLGRAYGAVEDPLFFKKMVDKRDPASEELRRRRVSESTRNMMWITDGSESRYIRNTEQIPEGFRKGRTLTREAKKHIREARENLSEEAINHIRKIHREDTSNRIWITDGNVDRYISKTQPVPSGFVPGRCKIGSKSHIINHKVVSVEKVHQPCRVYDLTIEDNHNFALDAGVFVHNSKDASDSVAGALWNATIKNPNISITPKATAKLITSVNGRRGYSSRDPLSSMFPFANQVRKK